MVKRVAAADRLIALNFLIIGMVVLIHAYRWSFRSALFPLLAGWLLVAFSIAQLTTEVIARMRVRPTTPSPVTATGTEDEGAEDEVDVFGTASPGEWLAAFGWMAFFFVGLWLFGALIGIPLFALVYLLVASRESAVTAVVYAFACWAFVYGLFDRGLHVPLPAGVLLPYISL